MKKKTIQELALQKHKQLQGKIEVTPKAFIRSKEDLSIFYTPGVGAVSSHVANHPEQALIYTMKQNSVAIVSDGSAVLGLGNIGPLGALPVMEGKAVLFKTFAGVNAFPIVLETQDTEEIISIVKNISSGFGGINLEDISAPRCFEIEDRLKNELDIPVMHDDQHGTAIVVLAGLINAAKVVQKNMKTMKFTVVGAGAAGTAIAKILVEYGVDDVLVTDSQGIIHKKRPHLIDYKQKLAKLTNNKNIAGDLEQAIAGVDAVIGVSGPDTISPAYLTLMNPKSIVFALANPIPEIMPNIAKSAGARVIATGRSDFPNQINNSLAFPGIFRGALDAGVTQITDKMKIQAAKALANLVAHPTPRQIIPSNFNRKVASSIAKAIR